jgi:hypothetical protein
MTISQVLGGLRLSPRKCSEYEFNFRMIPEKKHIEEEVVELSRGAAQQTLERFLKALLVAPSCCARVVRQGDRGVRGLPWNIW